MSLKYGTSIREESIKLGKDVFMECLIESNPPEYNLTWLFNDKPLAHNVSAGIIMSSRSLVLQRIKIENRGYYQCEAHNAMGKSMSNKLSLNPECKYIAKDRDPIRLIDFVD